jgi:DNA-binding response OmpR family regulator
MSGDPAEKTRVLIGDSDRTVADTLGLIFERWGFDYRKAYDDDQFRAIACSWHPQLAVVGLWVNYPTIREIYPLPHLLLLSSTPYFDREALRLGQGDAVLFKPVAPSTLLGTVKELLGQEIPEPAVCER